VGDAAPAAPPPADAEAGPAALPDLPGITLAPRPLNRGPFAAVYQGWDRDHRCDVIVKVQRATGDAVAAERFRREAAVMKRLRHPNVVALYQFHDGDPAALVLEYVPGRTLAEAVEADGWLSPQRAASVIEDIAAALDCAHGQGIIHRDVKPSNILLPTRGSARLFDFGVAHIDEDAPLTVMGDILGTIEYASPEQVHGNEAPDARSDVYSLAGVAYFALVKTPPFRAADSSTQAQLSVMHRQVFADPPPMRLYREELSPAVEAAVLRGLAKAPASRYESAGQFAAALRAAVEAGAGAPELRAMAAASRRTGALAGGLAGATLLLLGALALWRTGEFAAPHPARAAQVTKQTLPKAVAPAPKPIAVAQVPKPKPSATVKPAPKVVAAVRPRPKLVKTATRAAPVHRRSPRLIAAVVPRRAPRPSPRPVRLAARVVPPKATVVAETAPGRAWLYVYAKQDLAPSGRPTGILAQSVWVDGYRASDLAGGRWTSLPAGRHLVSFVPDPKSGFAPRKNVVVTLAPGAHTRRQILLAAMPVPARPFAALAPAAAPPVGLVSVSGWLPVAAVVGQKPQLVPVAAEWVKIDGRPSPALARGLWVSLPAGRHVLVFQPLPGSGADPATRVISLAPRARLNQLMPLPAAPLPIAPLHLRNP